MPDGTSRFSIDGKPIFHFMGCSTFSGMILELLKIIHRNDHKSLTAVISIFISD
jgi:Zn-dependent alcohol dehydrogenase